jgi:3-dehydroquinate dehydratase-1
MKMFQLKPLICVSIIKKSVSEILKVSEMLKNQPIDLIELRLDHLEPFPDYTELSRLFEIKIPKIITIRSKKESGEWKDSEQKRIQIINRILEEKIDFIDLEFTIDNIEDLVKIANKNNIKVIISKHDFKSTPKTENLIKLFDKILLLNPEIIKIATMIKNINNIISQLELIKYSLKKNKNSIIIGMGKEGKITRLLNPLFGSKIVYCSIPGEPAAPGQLDYKKMNNLFTEFRI